MSLIVNLLILRPRCPQCCALLGGCSRLHVMRSSIVPKPFCLKASLVSAAAELATESDGLVHEYWGH